MRWKKAACLVGCVAMVSVLGGCCEECLERMKRQYEVFKQFIKDEYTNCCSPGAPPNVQNDCIQEKGSRVSEAQLLIPQAFDACRDRQWDRLRELYEEMKELLGIEGSVVVATPFAPPVNSVALLLEDESVAFGASASERGSAARDAVYVNGRLYTTHAAGNIEAALLEAGQQVQVMHVDEAAPNGVMFHEYAMNSGSSLTISSASRGALQLGWSGSIVLSQFEPDGNGTLRAVIDSVNWSLSSGGTHETMGFELIASHPSSEVVVDANGVGVATVVGRLVSTTRPFYPVFFDSVVIRVPVDFSADWSSVSLSTAGREDWVFDDVAPVGNAQDEPFIADDTNAWCDDTDNNGIPDRADEHIESLERFVDDVMSGWCD